MSSIDYFNKTRFVEIAEGTYTVGLDAEDVENAYKSFIGEKIKKEYLYNSYPAHKIILNKIFISKKLVTAAEFEQFILQTGYKTEAELEGWGWVMEESWKKKDHVNWMAPFGDWRDKEYFSKKEIVPVLMVTWNDAVSYCNWLSKKEDTYRLPSEFELEVFAGDVGIYTIDPLYLKDDDFFKRFLNAVNSETDITKPGIIWEWTDDYFDSYPGGIQNREFGTTYRVLRGGSIASIPAQRIKEYRFRRCPTARSPFYGFRVALKP